MSRAGSELPDFPDTYGHQLARESQHVPDDALFTELVPELTDAQMDAMWKDEKARRDLIAFPHAHRCGHVCESGACVVMAGLNDWFCIACQLRKGTG
jgi:hypothetical protein